MIGRVALRQTTSICFSQVRDLSIMIPKIFWLSTDFISSLSRSILSESIFVSACLKPTVITEVFFKRICISFLRHQTLKLSEPIWRSSCTVFSCLWDECTVESSADKSTYASLINKGRSLTNKGKRTGPNTDPSGTPALTECNEDWFYLLIIHCFLPDKYEFIQFSVTIYTYLIF